jgi:hypothetical protein
MASGTQKKGEASRGTCHHKVITSRGKINLSDLLADPKVTTKATTSCGLPKGRNLEGVEERGFVATGLYRNCAGLKRSRPSILTHW